MSKTSIMLDLTNANTFNFILETNNFLGQNSDHRFHQFHNNATYLTGVVRKIRASYIFEF